jgi:hypothetical protein
MSVKLKTAVIGGALTALAIPTASAHAAVTHPASTRPGLTDPSAKATTKDAAKEAAPGGHAKVPAASAATCAAGTITWQDKHDNYYLEIYHSGTAAGNWADAYPGDGTCTQRWFAEASGSSSFFTAGQYETADFGMVNANSYLCLAASMDNIGNEHVVQESCGYDSYNDRWKEASQYTLGGYELVEVILNGVQQGDTANFVAACEDVNNHWIYTSHWSHGYSAYNCIWH